MPLYDFVCNACTSRRELMVPAVQYVVECDCGEQMERQPPLPAMITTGCPGHDSKFGRSMRKANIAKRKKMYTDRGKPLPSELANTE